TKTAQNEPDPNHNNDMASASVTATSVADLAITKTDGLDTVFAGNTVTYSITVSNRGPSDVVGAPVQDTFPPELTNVSWSCVAPMGSSCSAGSGTGNIDTTVSLPRGGSLTFTVNARVSPTVSGVLTNTATVATP